MGKVTQVEANGEVFHYLAYLRPEQTKEGARKSHHSKSELVRTDEASKEFVQNVVKHVSVVRLQEFIAKF